VDDVMFSHNGANGPESDDTDVSFTKERHQWNVRQRLFELVRWCHQGRSYCLWLQACT